MNLKQLLCWHLFTRYPQNRLGIGHQDTASHFYFNFFRCLKCEKVKMTITFSPVELIKDGTIISGKSKDQEGV